MSYVIGGKRSRNNDQVIGKTAQPHTKNSTPNAATATKLLFAADGRVLSNRDHFRIQTTCQNNDDANTQQDTKFYKYSPK
jgi:hypothetical protein